MLKRLVIEHKIVDYQYFMDEMQMYEILLLDDLVPYADKGAYEQLRILMWSNFKSTGCRGVPKPEKLLPLSTDEESDSSDDVLLNNEQQIMVSKQIQNMFKNRHGKQS